MHLIQILLPRYDVNRARFDDQLFAQTRSEIVERFGGVTAYLRSPAAGAWLAPGGSIERDEVVAEVERNTPVYPVTHGARVELPRLGNEEPSLFDLIED